MVNASPRKVVPLASGDEPSRLSVSTAPRSTKRVFFCGVVIEGSEGGVQLPEDIQDLVLSFGEPVSLETDSTDGNSSPDLFSQQPGTNPAQTKQRPVADGAALNEAINELVTTERSYVNRLQILKHDYADPLRKFARSKSTAIIPAYEAKTLFGNIDNLLPVHEAFLTDLEKMLAPNGHRHVGSIGDVALRHFKENRSFEHYKLFYAKREDAQNIERELMKKSVSFVEFIDRIKYSSVDVRNRIGLHELLMEPVQRLPRYTLLFRTMIKHMAADDPQRAKLIEADEIASKIARAEPDEQTKRAATMRCLSASIDQFPPGLISNSRQFIDCIDVEDVLAEVPLAPSSAGNMIGHHLHCTLFLFDDKLMIVKRPSNGEKGGRELAGLDDVDRITKAGGMPSGKKRPPMSCKGVVDLCDLVMTDIGGPAIHLFLENPPMDQTERWSGRPFRSLSVVNPPSPINLDPTRTEAKKNRFLENLWRAQALYRTRAGQSVVLCSPEQEVESKGGKTTIAKTYYNVFQRSAFLQESKKTKVVVHIDGPGTADPIPFGTGGTAPHVAIRIQPLAGELCRYNVTCSDPNDEGEEDIVQTARVANRIVQTIHQFGLFKFRTDHNSAPSTPTASMRSRAAIFGLDAISRNLFNSKYGSTRGEFFGGSIASRKRSKSAASRSSLYTHSTGTTEGSLSQFSRAGSSTTAATTLSVTDDESVKRRKATSRARSPIGSDSDGDVFLSVSRARTTSASSSKSALQDTDYSDLEDEAAVRAHLNPRDQSEIDLQMRLELARKNSQNMSDQAIPSSPIKIPTTEPILEEKELPPRPLSRASTLDPPFRHLRSDSQSSERRPHGPRSPSPLPPSRPVSPTPVAAEPAELLSLEPSSDDGDETDQSEHSQPYTPLPRSKRQIFPRLNLDRTPKATTGSYTVEPLSIKKRSSVTSTTSNGVTISPRKPFVRNSPLSRTSARVISPRRFSPRSIRGGDPSPVISNNVDDISSHLLQLVQALRLDCDASQRAVKRIRLEADRQVPNLSPSQEGPRPASPVKQFRTPQRNATPAKVRNQTKEASERMEEMRKLIGKRQGDEESVLQRSRPAIFPSTPGPAGQAPFDESVTNTATEAENALSRLSGKCETLKAELEKLAKDVKDRLLESERNKVELQHSRRQCELVKSLLADVNAEKEIMYEAFNEELDAMYNDANMPEDEAWSSMSKDLRETKEARNKLSLENSDLKRQLAEVELQKNQWGELLRAHGLI